VLPTPTVLAKVISPPWARTNSSASVNPDGSVHVVHDLTQEELAQLYRGAAALCGQEWQGREHGLQEACTHAHLHC